MKKKDEECSNLSTSKSPWLVCFQETSDNEAMYFSLEERTSYKGSIPHILGKHCWGCFYGWLMLTNSDSTVCFLFNPISMETIQLPPLDVGEATFHCLVILPPTDPNCRVLLLVQDFASFLLSRPRASEWVKVKYDYSDYIQGLAYYKGKVYFVSPFQNLRTIEIFPLPKITNVIQVKHPGLPYGHRASEILIESRNELFMVTKIVWGNTNTLRTIEVLRMDFDMKNWMKVHNIGGRVFLCNGIYSLSYYPPTNSKVKGDHIYMYEFDTNYLYAFDLKDGSISVDSIICDPDPIPYWFTPLSDNTTNQEERIQTSLERNHGIPDDTPNVQIALTDNTSSNSNTPSILWLLFTHNNDGKWKFLDPSCGKVYFHHFPDLSDVTFRFAKDG